MENAQGYLENHANKVHVTILFKFHISIAIKAGLGYARLTGAGGN